MGYKNWVDGDVLTASNLKNAIHTAAISGLCGELNSLRADVTGDTLRAQDDTFYDIAEDTTKVSAFSGTTLYTTANEGYFGLDFQNATPDKDCDFTGAGLDTDFTLFDDGSATATFDAANNEVDLYDNDSAATNEATMYYNTNKEFAVVIVKLRNIVMDTSDDDEYITLYAGTHYIRIHKDASNNYTVENDNSDSTALAGAPTDFTLKICKYGGRIATYYHLTGGTPTTQLGTNYAGTVGASQLKLSLDCDIASGSPDLSCSVYDWKMYWTYELTGTLVTTTDTIGTTKTYEVDFCDVDNTANTSVGTEISHDNGSNYTSITIGDGLIGTAGTTLKKRYTLTTSSSADTPKIYGHINYYSVPV